MIMSMVTKKVLSSCNFCNSSDNPMFLLLASANSSQLVKISKLLCLLSSFNYSISTVSSTPTRHFVKYDQRFFQLGQSGMTTMFPKIAECHQIPQSFYSLTGPPSTTSLTVNPFFYFSTDLEDHVHDTRTINIC